MKLKVKEGAKGHMGPDGKMYRGGEEFEVEGDQFPEAFRDKLEMVSGGKDELEVGGPELGIRPRGPERGSASGYVGEPLVEDTDNADDTWHSQLKDDLGRNPSKEDLLDYAHQQGVEVDPSMRKDEIKRKISQQQSQG